MKRNSPRYHQHQNKTLKPGPYHQFQADLLKHNSPQYHQHQNKTLKPGPITSFKLTW